MLTNLYLCNRKFFCIYIYYFLLILKVRGRDYAIDLCGTLDIFKPCVALMVLSQSVNIPSWKIAIYFPQLISRLNAIENNLDMILEGESPNKDLLPILSKH